MANDNAAAFEELRMTVHDTLSAMSDRMEQMAAQAQAPKQPEGPPPDQVAGLLSTVAMIEGRIGAGEQNTVKAFETAMAPIKTAIEQLHTASTANTAALTQMAGCIDKLVAAVTKPRKRTGTVNLPEGQVTMTVVEHTEH